MENSNIQKKESERADSLARQAITHYKSKNYEQAISCLEQAIEIAPENHNYAHLLGVVHFANEPNNTVRSIPFLKKAVQLKPENATYYFDLGIAFFRSGENEQAKSNLRKAIELNPNVPHWHYHLGSIYFKSGNYDLKNEVDNFGDAIPCIEKAIAMDPNNAEWHFRLGEILMNMNEFKQAIPHFERSIALDPANPECYINLGVSNYKIKNFVEAIPYLERSVKQVPDNGSLYYLLGIANRDLDKNHEVIPNLEKAVLLNPQNSQWLLDIVIAYFTVGDYEKAFQCFKKLLAINSSFLDNYKEIFAFIKECTNKHKVFAIWVSDFLDLARLIFCNDLINNASYYIVSENNELIGKKITYKSRTLKPVLSTNTITEYNVKHVIIGTFSNANYLYEQAVNELKTPLTNVFMMEAAWKNRLYHKDELPYKFKNQIPVHIKGGCSSDELLIHMYECLETIKNRGIEGDIINLGVFKGYSMYYFSLIRDYLGLTEKKIIGFDTFSGFVKTDEFYDTYIDRYGKNSFRYNSREVVAQNLGKFENIQLIEGDIRETVKFFDDDIKICMALFDMDEYTPAAVAMQPVFNKLSSGGFFVHDHYAFPSLSNGMYGQRQAMNEFLLKNNLFHLTGTNIFMKY